MSPEVLLHEPWPDRRRETEGYLFSMWIFLATEVMFFGALITLYAVNRWAHPQAVVMAAGRADFVFGTINTAVLLTSSLAMAIADRAMEEGLERLAFWALWLTLLLGAAFLVVKGFEYRKDLADHLWPAGAFALQGAGARPFWSFYWVATGIHAIHVTIGLALILRLILLAARVDLGPHQASLSTTTLYWHFVDVVWLVLYALLYLAGRA